MNGSWDAFLASPADFAGADDIIINLLKEREPGGIKRTPESLLITSNNEMIVIVIIISWVLCGSHTLL